MLKELKQVDISLGINLQRCLKACLWTQLYFALSWLSVCSWQIRLTCSFFSIFFYFCLPEELRYCCGTPEWWFGNPGLTLTIKVPHHFRKPFSLKDRKKIMNSTTCWCIDYKKVSFLVIWFCWFLAGMALIGCEALSRFFWYIPSKVFA